MKEMTGNFREKAKRAGAVYGAGVRLLAVVLIALMVATAGGCGKGGGGPSLTGPDQTDPKKFAEYIINELITNKNPKVMEKYASYELKEQMKRAKADIEYSRKAGLGDGRNHIEQWNSRRGELDNKWGKVVSYDIVDIRPTVTVDQSRERLDVKVAVVREHFKVSQETVNFACRGLNEDECKKKLSWAMIKLVKEHDGKWYVDMCNVT